MAMMSDKKRLEETSERTIDRLARETGIPMWALEIAFELASLGMLDEETLAGDRVIPNAARVIADLLQQPTSSEECVECHHSTGVDPRGRCVETQRDPGGSLVYCGCKCVFPATGAGEGDQQDVVSRAVIIAKLKELEVRFNWEEAGDVVCGIRQFVESLPPAKASNSEKVTFSVTDLLPSTPDGKVCECRCHGYHEVRATSCQHCATPPTDVAEAEAHRCPRCGRRMRSELDEDVGFWRECVNCDYRESVSSASTEPAAAKAAAREIASAYVNPREVTSIEDAEQGIAAIISKHLKGSSCQL